MKRALALLLLAGCASPPTEVITFVAHWRG
jgi:hypothetical protein